MRTRLLLLLIAVIALVGGAWLVLKPDSPTTATKNYAALGDSVAAGLGLPASSLASHQDSLCGRSADAYPVQVALKQQAELHDYACSGAKVNDLAGTQKVKGSIVPSQVDRAFKNGAPQLITISIGANDINFAGSLAECYASDCTAAANTAAIQARITQVGTDVSSLLKDITQRSAGKSKIIVVGYYTLVTPDCTKFEPRITPAKAAWIVARTNDLNNSLQTAANQSHVHYVAANFAGHDLCSNDPWIQGLTTIGALHPTADGQTAIAKAVLQAAQ